MQTAGHLGPVGERVSFWHSVRGDHPGVGKSPCFGPTCAFSNTKGAHCSLLWAQTITLQFQKISLMGGLQPDPPTPSPCSSMVPLHHGLLQTTAQPRAGKAMQGWDELLGTASGCSPPPPCTPVLFWRRGLGMAHSGGPQCLSLQRGREKSPSWHLLFSPWHQSPVLPDGLKGVAGEQTHSCHFHWLHKALE